MFKTPQIAEKGSHLGGVIANVIAAEPNVAGSNSDKAMDFKGDKNPQHAFLRMGSKAGRSHVVRFYSM
jgi:hypothetical protein